MGWWNAADNGASLRSKETGLVWGDGPADWMDGAVDKIVQEFQESWFRKPTKKELQAGLLFALSCYEEPTKAEVRKAAEMVTAFNEGEITRKELSAWYAES